MTRTEVLLARDTLYADLQQFKRDADADLAAGLQAELAGATARYQALKVSAGALDYADLLTRARDLIRGNEDVRRHLQQKFSRIFVDEFQDTDPVQAEILLLLSSRDAGATRSDRIEPLRGKLFIVGDPKQAIYRFRGTDVGTYLKVRDQLKASGGRVLQLTTSYRSLPEIQRFVNAAFAEEMVANDATLQAGYVPLSEWRTAIADPQPAVVALPVPCPYSARGPLRASGRAIEESLPDAIGAFIKWLIEKSGWTVGERGADDIERQVSIRPQHIAILFRRFVSFGEDITRRYIDAIEARAIPHLLVGGKAFHGREEVETIRAALAAIEWPDDELSVFATLKGSLFAIDDANLLEFHHRFRVFHPYRVPKELGGNSGRELALTAEPTAHLMPIAEALRLLQDLHRRRNYRPWPTRSDDRSQTRAHVGFILRPGGEQALANVLSRSPARSAMRRAAASRFEGSSTNCVRPRNQRPPKRRFSKGSDGVRLYDRPGRGLEFPDRSGRPHMPPEPGRWSRYLDAHAACVRSRSGVGAARPARSRAEEVERDKPRACVSLMSPPHVPRSARRSGAWRLTREGGWISPLNRRVSRPSPRAATRRAAPVARRSSPKTLRRSGRTRKWPDHLPSARFTGCRATTRRLVDPSALDLDAPRLFGVRREDPIVKDVARNVVADGREIRPLAACENGRENGRCGAVAECRNGSGMGRTPLTSWIRFK